jgi:hypothetical protein
MRPLDLARRMAETEQQVFTLPLKAARRKACDIIDQAPGNAWLPVEGDPTFFGRRLRFLT